MVVSTIDAKSGINRDGYLEIKWRINANALEFIEGVGEVLTFDSDERIVRQGESGSSMFLILSGSVRVVKSTPQGDQIVATLGKLRSFGEVALLTNSPRNASVYAIDEVRVLKISRENLGRLGRENPHIALPIYKILAESLARSLSQTSSRGQVQMF